MDQQQSEEREGYAFYELVTCFKRNGTTESERARAKAFERLPQIQRELLYPADEGKSDQEIAHQLGVALNTLRAWKQAAQIAFQIGAIAVLAHIRAARPEGFTISPISAQHTSIPCGYVIGLDGFERNVEGTPSIDLMELWLKRHWNALLMPPLLPTQELLCPWFGGWAEGSAFVLDISVIIQDKTEAFKVAQNQNQIAMWDLTNNEPIFD